MYKKSCIVHVVLVQNSLNKYSEMQCSFLYLFSRAFYPNLVPAIFGHLGTTFDTICGLL